MISDYNIGVRSTLYDDEMRLRRKAALRAVLLYGSLLVNVILAIKLASCRMGF